MQTTDILGRHIIASEHAMDCKVGSETVILHATNGTYYGLDPVGTQIWNAIKDGVQPPAICSAIAEEFGVELAQVEQDARAFLADLQSHDIVIVT